MSFLDQAKEAKKRLGLCEEREERKKYHRIGKEREVSTGREESEVAKKAPTAWQPSYAHPWPDALPGLGPRWIGPFDLCVACGRGSWARYGDSVLCCPCAIARTER